MSGQIFNIQEDGKLVEMREAAFASEDLFQELLQNYPNLLAGDQIDSTSPRRWLLVKREMGIASEEDKSDRWSLDHLFLDQDGIPTLVEVKRSSDTRIRREVVGQVLDYAANAVVHWSVDRVDAEFNRNAEKDGVDAEVRLAEFLDGGVEAEEFWQKVKTNLQAGRIRLLFVADVIPAELKRVVEFLNQQMDPAEVLAVEIRHFVGQGMKTLVPRVIGQTAEAEARKAPGAPYRERNSSASELQKIAEEHGVGIDFDNLVSKLSGLFEQVKTSKHTITFNAKLDGFKQASVFNLNPNESNQAAGVRFGAYVDRIALLAKVDNETVIKKLPELDLKSPNFGAGYRTGFTGAHGLDQVIELLKDVKGGV